MEIQEREAFENALQKRHKNILRWVMWVESIQKYVMNPETERHDDVYADKAYRKIQDFLYAWQAAKASVPEWISVDDNPPPADVTVLVCWDYHPDIEPEKEYMTSDEDLNEYWPNCEDEPPTHWMPLPEAPKAQESPND